MQLVVVVAMGVLPELAHHAGRSVQHHRKVVTVNGLFHVIGVFLDLAGGLREEVILPGNDLGWIHHNGELGRLWRHRWALGRHRRLLTRLL